MTDQIELLKKAFAILLFVAFFINCIGYYLIYKADIYSIKLENRMNIAKGIVSTDQLVIKVNIENGANQDKNLEEEGRDEVRWYGKLYDLIKKEIRNGSIYYYCQQDDTENDVIAANENLVQNQTDHSTNKKLISIYKSIQLFCTTIGVPAFENKNCLSEYASYFPEKLSIIYSDINIPPPQFS